MTKRIDGIRLKIERAKKHVLDLDIEIKRFLNTKPYKVSTKSHPQLPYATVFFVTSAEEIPLLIPIIVGDAVQNLRSSLDHLAWQLVEVSGGKTGTYTGFPIYDPAAFKTKKEETHFFTRKVQGMRKDIQDTILATKPYKGGNDTLWTIHYINNTDKHRLLITVGFTTPKFAVKAGTFQTMFPLAGWYPLKEGETIVTIPRELEPNEYPEFIFEIVLGESGIFQGKALLESLTIMVDSVNDTVTQFEPFLI